MNTEGTNATEPSGSPLDGRVRPSAWWHRAGDQFAHAKRDGSRPFARCWEPLYDQAALDMERERCAAICDRLAVMSLDPMVCRGSAEECAEAIRFQDGAR